MENKELYKITTSSEHTQERLMITIKLDLLKIKGEYLKDNPGGNTEAHYECLATVHRSLLTILEDVIFDCRHKSDNSGFSKHSYFSKILKEFSVDDLREIRSIMINRNF